MSTFGCQRLDIESIFRPVQRNMLIQAYCSERFETLNLVDFYYRRLNSNAFLVMLVLAAFIPLLFSASALIAEKFIAEGMQGLTGRFRINQALAAVTLIAFAGGAPDILASLANSKSENSGAIVVGIGIGVYLFGSTLILAAAALSNKAESLALPKLPILKELFFSITAILLISLFGIFQSQGVFLMSVLFVLYAAYIATTLFINKKDEGLLAADEGRAARRESSAARRKSLAEIQNKQERSQSLFGRGPSERFEMELREIDLTSIPSKEQPTLLDEILAEVLHGEEGHPAGLLHSTVNCIGLVTIPYLKNPLMNGPTKFLPLTIAFALIIKTFISHEISLLLLLLISLAMSGLLFAFEQAKVSEAVLDSVYESVSIFAGLVWLDLVAMLIVDLIAFLAFYFSINEVILSTVLLSLGNSIGELFTVAALARQGAGLMAALSVYSAQFLNLVATVALNIAVNLGSEVAPKFDIFGLGWFSEPKEYRGRYPVSGLFLVVAIASALVILLVHIGYYVLNDFKLGKTFGKVSIGIYSVFFAISILFSHLSR